MQAVSRSCSLQHQEPLTAVEIDSVTMLFNELVLVNKELSAIEEKRGLNREAVLVQETSAAMKDLLVDGNLDMASEKITTLHHQEKCDALDREFNTVRQKFLHTTFKVVEYLRTLNEYIAWECDLSLAIGAMQRVNGILKYALESNRVDPLQAQSLMQSFQHMDEEIKQHQDQSSELFIRTAYGIAIHAKEEADDGALRLCQQTAIKCVHTFEAFRKNLIEMSQKDPVFPEGYNAFVLSLKAFALALKNYKNVGSTITRVQCLQPFAPPGMTFAVRIPELEL